MPNTPLSAVAYMVATPGLTPLMEPVLSKVTMDSLLLDQVTSVLVAFSGSMVAVSLSVKVPVAGMVIEAGATMTSATSTDASTCTVQISV